MSGRQHSSELIKSEWGCERCCAGGDSNNAQGLAAQHHDKKGHRTWVTVTRRFVYGAATATDRRNSQTRMDL